VEEATGENRIIISPGANGTLTASSLPDSLVHSSKLHHRRQPDLLVAQLEIPLPTVLFLASLRVPLLLNPAPAVPLPTSLYPQIDILVLNESEAGILTGVHFPSSSTPTTTTTTEDDDDVIAASRDAVAWFVRHGSRRVVITLGALGAVFQDCYEDGTVPGGGGGGATARHVSARKVDQVVDTTAAGDTFVGALAVSYVAQLRAGTSFSLEKAVDRAIVASSWTVQRRGTWEAMPSTSDLDSL